MNKRKDTFTIALFLKDVTHFLKEIVVTQMRFKKKKKKEKKKEIDSVFLTREKIWKIYNEKL